mgnify:CR=1 FL=1
MVDIDVSDEAFEAEKRIRPYIWVTPLEYSRYLSEIGKCDVFLKLENMQRSGSFKFRGAANFLLALTKEEVQRGIITASTGNHGAAVAEILGLLDFEGTICLPENVSAGKVDSLKYYKNVNLNFASNGVS